jgi:PAS domain S-box-containing protein
MAVTNTLQKHSAVETLANTVGDSLERTFNLLLDTSEDLIFVLDENGCFENVGYKGAISLGYLPNELRKKHFSDLIPEKSKYQFVHSIRQALVSDKPINAQLTLLSKGNEEFKHQVILNTIKSENEIKGVLGICKNLTKETALQEKITALKGSLSEANRLLNVERQRSYKHKIILHELNRLKGEFISQFSHEMRTPLSTIIGFSEAICSDDHLSDSMKIEFQQEILKEAKRLAKTVNDALEATNLQSGKGLLVKSELDCVELLKNVIYSNKTNSRTKNISLEQELPSEKFLINADNDKVIDVFDSILKNSIKHTPQGGKVKVFGQIFPHEIEIIFTDTGKGISQNDSKILLNPSNSFQIISKAKSETGIGLDFAKKIVDLHDGYMDIQSEIDKGTTIIIKFPRNLTD